MANLACEREGCDLMIDSRFLEKLISLYLLWHKSETTNTWPMSLLLNRTVIWNEGHNFNFIFPLIRQDLMNPYLLPKIKKEKHNDEKSNKDEK